MPIFNIRVYALLINETNEVLVTDEFRFGKEMTKFPGGGLDWGEGTIDCLKRECREELGCEIEILKHFYTTDFFQRSAFHKDHQLISIYYIVKNTTPFAPALKGENVQTPFRQPQVATEGQGQTENSQSFRWVSISALNKKEFTFPIDKIVAEMLCKQL